MLEETSCCFDQPGLLPLIMSLRFIDRGISFGSLVVCSSGRFGACFLPGLCKQSDLEVFAARPGLRLWRANVQGQVEDTHLLKSLFKMQVACE